MAINKESQLWHRYYNVPPDQKSIETCYTHGSDHRVYGWSPQYDPRWSEDQKKAYWAGYENRSIVSFTYTPQSNQA